MTERTSIDAGSRAGTAITTVTKEEFERERLSAESRLAAAREHLRLIDQQICELCARGRQRQQGNERMALRRLCSMRRQARRAYWRAGIAVACWRLSPAAQAYLATCTCRACGWRESAQPLIPMPLTEQAGLCDRCLHREDERQRGSALRRWARDLLLRSRQAPGSVGLDTGTTGLDPRADEVIELALLDGDTEHSLFYTVLCPTVPITSAAQAYHGLTAELLAAAPRFDAIAPHLLPLLTDKLVVVFNRFHVELLQSTALRYGVILPSFLLEEVQEVVRVAHHLRPASLPNVAAQFGVTCTGRRASEHALIVWQIVRSIASQEDEEPPAYSVAQHTYPAFALGTKRFPPEDADADADPDTDLPF